MGQGLDVVGHHGDRHHGDTTMGLFSVGLAGDYSWAVDLVVGDHIALGHKATSSGPAAQLLLQPLGMVRMELGGFIILLFFTPLEVLSGKGGGSEPLDPLGGLWTSTVPAWCPQGSPSLSQG